MSAKKVYVINSGCYSDRGVFGVCSTQKIAERIARFVPNSDVEEYVLDDCEVSPGKVKNGYLPFYVRMARDGNVIRCAVPRSLTNFKPDRCVLRESTFTSWQWAKTEKAAIKIANERRAQAIAEERA